MCLALIAPACIGPTTPDGSAAKLSARGDLVYAAEAGEGLAVLEASTLALRSRVALPDRATRVDDVTIAGDALFALDAVEGLVWSYALAEPQAPRLVSAPLEVAVGPFSGIAAAADTLIVSGGTSELTVLTIDGPAIQSVRARLELDRGQPDVALRSDGLLAIVSTHFDEPVDGHEFGVTSLSVEIGAAPRVVDRRGLSGAGFTDGLANPTNFPIQVDVEGGVAWVAHGGGVTRLAVDDAGHLTDLGTALVPGSPTAVSVVAERAFVVAAGEQPALLELGADASVFRTTPLTEDQVPIDVVATATAVFIATFGGPIERVAR